MSDAFLRDPDQAARRAELQAFIGPNAAVFLKTYDAMQAAAMPGGQRTRRWSFVALAFFLTPCWLLYRKMWVWGGGFLAVMAAAMVLPLPVELPLTLACAVVGRTLYLNHAMARITLLRDSMPSADLDVLAAAGGVSRTAGWISGVLLAALAAVAVAAAVVAVQDMDLSGVD